MSRNPYSLRTGALAGSAMAASALVLVGPFICQPENARGRMAGISAAKAPADETIRPKIRKMSKSRTRRDTERRTHYLCTLDYRGRGKVSRVGSTGRRSWRAEMLPSHHSNRSRTWRYLCTKILHHLPGN